MAKQRPSVIKRQREQVKRERQQAKAAKRVERKNQDPATAGDVDSDIYPDDPLPEDLVRAEHD